MANRHLNLSVRNWIHPPQTNEQIPSPPNLLFQQASHFSIWKSHPSSFSAVNLAALLVSSPSQHTCNPLATQLALFFQLHQESDPFSVPLPLTPQCEYPHLFPELLPLAPDFSPSFLAYQPPSIYSDHSIQMRLKHSWVWGAVASSDFANPRTFGLSLFPFFPSYKCKFFSEHLIS